MLNGLDLLISNASLADSSLSENAPYFASEVGVGLASFIGRGIGCGEFAACLHCGLGVVLGADAPPAEALYSFLQVVTYLVVLMVAVKKLLEKNPKHTDLATKHELDEKLKGKADQKDLDRVEREVKKIDNDLLNTERRILAKVEEMKDSILKEIKDFGKGAHNGRLALWEKLNKTAEKVAALENEKD